MASLVALAGGALINAVAFSGNNYMFYSLSSSDEERKRHDLATEKYQKDHKAWIEKRQEKIDVERGRQRASEIAEKNMQELDKSMRE